MKLSTPVAIFLLAELFIRVFCQNCTNPMLNYDIFDDIIFLENSTVLTTPLSMCNLTTGDYTCCSSLNANDVGVVYDKFKTRIEDYNTDWILNYKNIFNGYTDLNTMGITSDVPNLETAIKNVILEYRAEIKKLNKEQSLCASVPMQMFAGTLCLVCNINYQNYLRVLNPEEKNTNLSKYTIVYTKSNCDTIYTNCKNYLELRKNLETRVYTYLVKILDTLTQYIGEMPYENITLISSSFSNSSALNDPLMNTRLLSPTEECEGEGIHSKLEKNDVILNNPNENDEEFFDDDDLDLDDFLNITTTTSTHNLDFISRGLRSSGGRSGGRSSGSRSSGRSSSTSRSSSGSSSGRSTGSSSSSGGSVGGRSVYSSRTTYGARTSTASSTVKSGSSARSTFSTRTSTSSAYKSTSYSYTRTSRTYSYSRNSYVVIYNSRYGSLYRGYYYHNRYGTNGEKSVAQTNSSTGVSYKIASVDDYQGVLSPFYSATSLPSDLQTQESNYHQKYLDWMAISTTPNTLIENCPKNYKKCRVCVGNSCAYFTKATSEYYDKYCIMQ